jgi:hypothetical protein
MFRIKLGYRLYYLEFSSKQLGKYFSHLSDLKGYPDRHYNVNSLHNKSERSNRRTMVHCYMLYLIQGDQFSELLLFCRVAVNRCNSTMSEWTLVSASAQVLKERRKIKIAILLIIFHFYQTFEMCDSFGFIIVWNF